MEIAEGFFEDLDRRYEELTTYNPWGFQVRFVKDDIRNYKFRKLFSSDIYLYTTVHA